MQIGPYDYLQVMEYLIKSGSPINIEVRPGRISNPIVAFANMDEVKALSRFIDLGAIVVDEHLLGFSSAILLQPLLSEKEEGNSKFIFSSLLWNY
jgi:hypothetical protein